MEKDIDKFMNYMENEKNKLNHVVWKLIPQIHCT